MEEQQQQQPPAEPPPQSAGTPVSSGVIKVNARDADVADRDNSCCVKRKRGRPAKGAPKMTPKPPPLKLKKDEEDVCFICFDGGSLVLCDRRSCPKAYHPACIKRDEAFFRSKAKWNCGWHICSNCEKSSHYMCYTCTYSLCKGCTKDADYVRVRGNKGLCGICMKTIKLIENSAQGNKGEVDFDDKSSWEYLFKVYWMYLKEQLSISFDEVLKATNPWKVDVRVSCKVQTPDELDHGKVDNGSGSGSGSENSCIDIDSNSLKNNKCNGFNQRDLSTTCEPTGNICKTKNQINPNEPTIDDSTNAGVVRLGVSSAPADISPLLQPVGDILKDKLWHYQDPTGKVQGPFSMFQLQQWNAYKYFPPDLRIWRVGEKQDNSILLNGALSGKHSINVSLAHQSEQQSLGASVTMEENKENSQDGLSNSTKSEVCANNQIVEQSREQKVDDTCTQSNGKDESVKSNGSHAQSPCLTIQTDGNNSEGQSENFERREESSKCEIPCHDGPDIDPSPPSAAFSEKLTEGPSDKQREGPENEGNLEENRNVGSNKLAEGQSNSGQSDQKQSDNEENGNVGSNKLAEGQSNSGQSDQKQSDNEENGNVGSNKLAEGQSNSGQSDQKQSDNEENSGQSSGQNWKGPELDKTHPPCDASSWLAAIFGEPTADESVSDLLAEVEAMESIGGLESPTSMMKCDEELTDGSITDCLSFPNGLGPVLDVGKGDSLSSTGDLHLPSRPTAADVHPQQKIFGEPSSGASEAHFLKDWLEYKQSV